jgi:hypothetical protein
MMKTCIAVLAAIVTCAPGAAGQSFLQKSDWKDPGLERFLPAADGGVPWLKLDTKTKLPKGDLPIGREVGSVGRFVLGPVVPKARFSANASGESRRM